MYNDPKVFGFFIPVIEGQGCVSLAAQRMKKWNVKKVLVVHDKNLKELGIVDKVTKPLENEGISWISFDRVLPDPSDTLVEEGADFAHEHKIDGIIAIGGGSSIDTAKGINLLMNNPAPLSRYFAVGIDVEPGIPFIAIPTTSGTGSEMTAMGTISTEGGKGQKRACWPNIPDRLAIIDPEILIGMPRGLTVSTGLDAMAHSVEAMTNLLALPMGDSVAMESIRTIVKWLPIAANDPKNLEARAQMAHAAALGGIAFTNCGLHIGHSTAEIIGALFHVPHGNCCAAVLPSTIEYSAKYRPNKVRLIAEAMGITISPQASNEEIGRATADAVRALARTLSVKTIKDYGIEHDALVNERVAELVATNPSSKTCPNPPTIEEIMTILEDSYTL